MPCFQCGSEDSYPVWDMGFKGSHLCRPCFREMVDLDRPRKRKNKSTLMHKLSWVCLFLFVALILRIIFLTISR
jgi:hypothetical protein